MIAFNHLALLLAGSNSHHGAVWWVPFGLVWLAVLGAVIWLVLRSTGRRERAGIGRAREILAERYASGELSRDEYRERLGDLS